MGTISKEELIESLKPHMKKEGFKKNQTTWRKETEDVIYVLNIQELQWAHDDYYINAALYIKTLGNEFNPPEHRCHIRDRIDIRHSCTSVQKEIMFWFDHHGNIEKLKPLRQQSELTAMITMDATEYLDGLINGVSES